MELRNTLLNVRQGVKSETLVPSKQEHLALDFATDI